LIRDGVSLDAARAAILNALVDRSESYGGPRPGGVRLDASTADEFRQAAVDALLLRAGVPVPRVHPAARDVSASVLDLARTCLSRAGRTVRGGSVDLLVRQAMTTSDFPLLLADSVGKALRTGFETEPASHREWVRVVPVRDFRDQTRPILGSAPDLEAVLEHGEYTSGPMSEDSTSYHVAKYGRIVSLTWETLVNDDLGAFLRVVPALGQAARRKEADLVYALFAENGGTGPTMQDNEVLFHATHANITASASALDAAALGAGRTLLRRQTAVGGGQLSLVPAFLIVAPEYETTAENLLAAATRVRTGSVEVGTDAARPEWIARLTLVVEPRLTDAAVYLATAPTQIDTVELGHLPENADGPVIVEERAFVMDAMSWKARHVVGVKALDWRGLVQIPISA
jgi:phage major head subunit gpT-like protein